MLKQLITVGILQHKFYAWLFVVLIVRNPSTPQILLPIKTNPSNCYSMANIPLWFGLVVRNWVQRQSPDYIFHMSVTEQIC